MTSNIIGERYGLLKIIGPAPKKPGNNLTRVKVQCDCGAVKEITKSQLTRTRHPTRSCGCNKVAGTKAGITQHGHCLPNHKKTSEYAVWCNMQARCYNPKAKSFSDYGGRGIRVHHSWRGEGGFQRFLAHVGLKPDPKLTLDRIDNSKNYEPGNVRWATRVAQRANQRPHRRAA